MRYFTERGYTHQEVIDAIHLKYGGRARIMTRKVVPIGGIFGLFRREGVEYFGYVSDHSGGTGNPETERDIASREQILKNHAPERIRERGTNPDNASVLDQESADEDYREELFKKLETIEKKIGKRVVETLPPILETAKKRLMENEFISEYTDRIIEELKKDLSVGDLEEADLVWERLVLLLASKIRLYSSQKNKRRVFILVGPTGVGKTTTIAKLAALHSVSAIGGKEKVHLITLDNYRIGAQQQIKTYGEILQAQVDCVETFEDFEKSLNGSRNADLVLVDTIGRNPKDIMKLAEMRRMLEACKDGEVHLALSATSSAGAALDIMTQFAPFNCASVVITKIDEAPHIGGVLSAVMKEEKPISFITMGQRVPQDIKEAHPLQLLKRLTTLPVDWDTMILKYEEELSNDEIAVE